MKRILLATMILLVILILGIELRGLYLQPILLPASTIPPNEIVFELRTGNTEEVSIGFIHPDGSGLVVRQTKIPVGFLFDGNPLKVYSNFIDEVFTWSADGKYLGIKLGKDFRSQGVPILISPNGQFISCPHTPVTNLRFWTINDETILETTKYGLEPYKVILFDLAKCQQKQVLYESDDAITDAVLSSQGWLAMAFWNPNRIEIYSPDRKKYVINDTGNLAWSKDGEWLAYTGLNENEPTSLYIAKKDGSDIQKLVPCDYYPSWSPDGKWIVYGLSGSIYKINVETKETYKIADGLNPNWRWNIPQ
jgi:hypothetical protein